MKTITTLAFLLTVIVLPPDAAAQQAATEAKLPVSIARSGFTPAQAKELRDRYTYKDVITAGDVPLYHFLNVGQWMQTAMISRQGNVVDLAVAKNPDIGKTRIGNADGGVDLND